jgi:hypothetical protein
MWYVGISYGVGLKVNVPRFSHAVVLVQNESEQGRIQGALYSVQALASGTGPMAMRFVYHLTKDGAFLGPGSMFVFAGFLMLIAASCAFALPKDKADSRPSRRRSAIPNTFDENSETTTEEPLATFADAATPFLRDSSIGDRSSSPSYGTEML